MRLTLDSHRGHTVPLVLVAALGALYPLLRRPILTWGATSEEAASRLPGDELLEDADGVSTRAITIDAPAASVWPWLVQMGPSPRGGAYTYDWIENLLGLDMRSVDRVLPEFQHPEVGDTIGLGANRMLLERVESGYVLVWRSEDGNWVWTFVLEERDGSTRLISRNRFRLPTLAARIGMLPMEPGSLLMAGRCCAGSKSVPSGSRQPRRTYRRPKQTVSKRACHDRQPHASSIAPCGARFLLRCDPAPAPRLGRKPPRASPIASG